jgi:hypothetical protein
MKHDGVASIMKKNLGHVYHSLWRNEKVISICSSWFIGQVRAQLSHYISHYSLTILFHPKKSSDSSKKFVRIDEIDTRNPIFVVKKNDAWFI